MGASGSIFTVYFLPYQVRLVFSLAVSTPFSRSLERVFGKASVTPGLGVGGKIPKTEL